MSRSHLGVALAIVISLAFGPAPEAAVGDDSRTMVEAINQARAEHGLAPLRHHALLGRSAQRHAGHLLRTDRFGHAGRVRASERFRRFGEVLAWHNGPRPLPERAVRRWMRSAPHRGMLLSRQFRFAGAGRVRGNFRGRRCTIWVVHLGAR